MVRHYTPEFVFSLGRKRSQTALFFLKEINFSDLNYPNQDYYHPVGQSRVNDRWHFRTVAQVSQLDTLHQRIQEQKLPVISAGIVPIQYPGLTAKRGLLVRDPDGHAVLLYEWTLPRFHHRH